MRRHPIVFAIMSRPADTPHQPCSSLRLQPQRERDLRHRHVRPRKLHCQRHHCAVRGAQEQLCDLAEVRGSPKCSLLCQRPDCSLLSAPADRKANTFRARSLDLNRLGPEGGAALAEGLKGNSALTVLSYAARYSNPARSVRLSVIAR